MAKAGTVFVEMGLDATQFTKAQKDILTSSKQTALDSEKNFKTLGTQSDLIFNTMKQNAQSAYGAIAASAKSTTGEIARAHEAMGQRIKEINRQQGESYTSLTSQIKSNWIAVSASVAAAAVTIAKAHDLMVKGAKALQTELAFKNTASALGFDPDKYVSELKRVTNETVGSTTLMQKAMKGITGGINPDDMLKLAEVSRLAARRMGVEVEEAYEGITDAVEVMRTKTLVKMGLMTKDQAALAESAKSVGIEVDAVRIIWMNYQAQLEMMGTPETNAIERMKQHEVAVARIGKEAGKALIIMQELAVEFLKWKIEGDIAKGSWTERLWGKPGARGASGEWGGQIVTGKISEPKNLAPGPHTEDIGEGRDAKQRREEYLADLAKRTAAAKAAKADAQGSANEASKAIEDARRASEELDLLTAKTGSKLEEHLAQIQKKYNDLAPKLKGNVEALVRLEEWRTTAIAAEYAKQDEQTEKYFVDAVKNYDAGVKEMQQVIDDAQKTLDKKIETRGHLAIAIDPRSPAALQALKDEFNKKLDAQEIFAEDFELRERYRAKSIADIDRGWLIEQLKDQLTYYSGVEGYAEKTYELKKQLIELEARQAISKGSDPNAVAVKTAQELHDAYITAAESGDDFFAGVNAGLLEITKSHVTWGKAASDITKQVFSEMEGALSKSLYAIVMKDWEKSKGMENINKEREALDKKYEEDVARIKAEAAVRSEDDKAKVSDAEYVKKKIEELDKQMVDSKADLVKKEKELDKSWMDNFKLIWEDAWKSILQTVIEYVAKIVVEWAILKTLGFIFNVKLDGNGNIIPIGDSGSGASAGDSSSNAMAQVGSFAASTAMSKMVGYGWDKMMGGLAETGAGKEVIAYWESLKESLGFAPTAQATPAASTTVPAGTTSGMDIVNTMQGAVPASQYTTANVELTQAGLQALEAQSAGSTYLTEAGLSALEAQSALTASNSVYLTEAGLSALETQSGIIAANAAGMGAGTAGAGAAGMTTASVGGVGSGGMGGGMVGAGGGGAGATGAAAAAGWGGIIIGAILIAKMVQDSMLDNDKQALAMIVAAQNNMMALTGAGAFGVKTDRNERFLDVGWGGSGNKLEGLIAELNANLSSQNKIIERELPGTATSQAAIKERDAIQKQIDAQKAKLPPGFVGTEARQGLTWSGSGGGMVDDLGREQNKQKYISNTATDKEKAAFLANEREYMRSKFKDAKINSRAMTEEEKNYFLNEGLKGQTDAVIAEMKRIEEAKTEFAKKAQDAIKAGAMMTMGGIDSVTGEVTKATLEMNKGTEEQLAIFEKYQVSMDAYNQAIADGATEAEAYIAAQKASAAAVAGAAEGIVTMGESAYDAAGDLLYVQSSADAASVSSSAAAGSVQSLANTFGLSAAQAASLTATLADTDDGTRTIEETIALLAETLGLSAEKAGELARALEEIPSDVNTNINVTTTETTIPGEVVVPSMPAGSASGGWITGGSGMRDDVFLGMTPGVAHWGMGGEFIVNKEAARRNGGLLEYINNKRYAEGGMIPNRAIFGANPEPGMIPNPAISTIRNIYPSGWNPEGKTDTEKKQRELEIELLETDPTKHIEALIKQRRDEMELLDASLRPMQQMIWSGELQNENDAKSLELMKLEGKTKEALNLERERELQDMDPTTQAIQKQIWAQEIVNQKKDMEIQLLILSGEPMKALTIARNKELAALDQTLVPFQQQIWLWELNNQKQTMNLELMKLSGQSIEALALERNKELQALDPSLHAVQRQIWAQELTNQKRQLEIDLMNAQGKTVEALAATREDELKTIDPSLRGLKQMIWAEEDLAKKRSEIVAENYRTSVDFKRAFYTGNVGNIKGYDSGGYHPGGLRIVGESGPELEWTGPSNIFNPKKMGITASTNDLVTEVRGMREELHALGVQTVMNTGKSARVMSRWDSDGQPDIRYNNTATWGN